MRRLLPSLIVLLSGLTAHAQELFYPARYHVRKVVLSKFVSFNVGYKPVQTWNIDLLMVTKDYRVRIYNTNKNAYSMWAVGAPSYQIQLSRLFEPYRSTYDNITSELYSNGRYIGQIVPPAEHIPDPGNPTTIDWRSTVTGYKSLNLEWRTTYKLYKLTFYCRPIE